MTDDGGSGSSSSPGGGVGPSPLPDTPTSAPPETRQQPSASSPPNPRTPKPAAVKRGVSIGGAHTVSMGPAGGGVVRVRG